MDVPWSELPPELLEIIASNFTIYQDYLRFRAVCVGWRSNIPSRPRHFPCQFPWLMLPLIPHAGNIRAFFNLSDKRFLRFELPETSRKRCCGSSNGWLVLLEQNPTILLLNPLTRDQFQLPPITTFPKVLDFNASNVGREYVVERRVSGQTYSRDLVDMRDCFIKKVVLSTTPKDDDFAAVAILNETGELAYCKKGSDSWSMIDDAKSYSEDVVFQNGLFYAVSKIGDVAILDLTGDSPVVSMISSPTLLCGADILYLVVSKGEIFLVTRYLNLVGDVEPDLIYLTAGFDVYKLHTRDLNWAPVKNLGDRMFFLGGNSSLCLYASDFQGSKGNRVYFTDDYTEANDDGARGTQDVGVFSLEDGGIEPLPCWPGHTRQIWPPHIWVTPNPC